MKTEAYRALKIYNKDNGLLRKGVDKKTVEKAVKEMLDDPAMNRFFSCLQGSWTSESRDKLETGNSF